MPQRHSKNNNDLAFFTYDETRKFGNGTQKERLEKDPIKPFDACCLCLKPFIDPICCHKALYYFNIILRIGENEPQTSNIVPDNGDASL
nr:nitric oxide synthase-interacting protein [Ipomoea batatas]